MNMKLKIDFSQVMLLAVLLAALLPARASAQGPAITLPPEPPPDPAYQPGQGAPALGAEVGSGRRSTIGAYGEAHLVHREEETTANLERFVLFVGHHFNDWARFYSEIEIEDAKEIEPEQAYVELQPLKQVGVRAGLVVLPIGIINTLHEPPTFNGVGRPLTDQLIVPSTWRELGLGLYGEAVAGLHWQLALVTGLDAAKLSVDRGLAPGRGAGMEAPARDGALVGRVHWNGLLGLDSGVSFYSGGAGQHHEDLGGVRVSLVEADARYARHGLGLRAEYARVFIHGDDAAARITAFQRATNPAAPVLGSQMQGFYLEAGYDLLRLLGGTAQQLVIFSRYESVNTRARVPAVLGAEHAHAAQFLFAGLSYLPHPQIAFKTDYRRAFQDEGTGLLAGEDQLSVGLGFMF